MSDNLQFEIPNTMRDMAERNVEQAKAAYGQFLDMAKRAQDAVTKSQGALTSSAMDIQARALRYAEQNINASFTCAAELARARDIKEYMEIQSRHAQKQIQTYAQQAQELGRLMAEAAEKAK